MTALLAAALIVLGALGRWDTHWRRAGGGSEAVNALAVVGTTIVAALLAAALVVFRALSGWGTVRLAVVSSVSRSSFTLIFAVSSFAAPFSGLARTDGPATAFLWGLALAPVGTRVSVAAVGVLLAAAAYSFARRRGATVLGALPRLTSVSVAAVGVAGTRPVGEPTANTIVTLEVSLTLPAFARPVIGTGPAFVGILAALLDRGRRGYRHSHGRSHNQL